MYSSFSKKCNLKERVVSSNFANFPVVNIYYVDLTSIPVFGKGTPHFLNHPSTTPDICSLNRKSQPWSDPLGHRDRLITQSKPNGLALILYRELF